MIKILATLCRLSNPVDCHETLVTSTDYQDLTMTACLIGMPALAKWMEGYPQYRLAGWKCQLGNREEHNV